MGWKIDFIAPGIDFVERGKDVPNHLRTGSSAMSLRQELLPQRKFYPYRSLTLRRHSRYQWENKPVNAVSHLFSFL
jgi:hypothetical protein